jgi:hypothetical protein
MLSQGASKVGAGFVAGALLVTMTAGVTFAASKTSGARACVSKTGALALLRHGKCAKDYSKTTLGAKGATGARGPRGSQGVKGDTGPMRPILRLPMSSRTPPRPARPQHS